MSVLWLINSIIGKYQRSEAFMNGYIKTSSALILVMLLSFTGCGRKQKPAEKVKTVSEPSVSTAMPELSSDIKQKAFDDDIAEFALIDEDEILDETESTVPQKSVPANPQEKEDMSNEFSWIEDEEKQDEALQAVYFDFDKYSIRKDQEKVLEKDINAIKAALNGREKSAAKAIVIVEGHSCSSAGSAAYNLALSEKRAKVVADRLASSGISHNQIKIVGRGQECPAYVNGQPVTGSREQQWQNRRDEVRIINA